MTDQDIRNSFLEHGKEFRALFRQLGNRSQSHAYLITGEKGTGKKTLARLMCASLLCSSESDKPCGMCRNCSLVQKNDHPDMILIEQGSPILPGAKKDRSTIPVEDIREMIRLCGTRSTDGNIRVVLIFGADRMTAQAQNCLLKTLEDPPPDVCMILVTDHMESLLSTVISRCSVFRMKAWDDAYIRSFLLQKGMDRLRIEEALSEANGSIGEAMRLVSEESYWNLREEVLNVFFRNTSRGSILKISNQWKDRKQDAEQVLSILESFVRKLTEARIIPEKSVDLKDFPPQWRRFSENSDRDQFIGLSETISTAKKQLQYSTNFQAVFEKILFAFIGEGNKWLQ